MDSTLEFKILFADEEPVLFPGKAPTASYCIESLFMFCS